MKKMKKRNAFFAHVCLSLSIAAVAFVADAAAQSEPVGPVRPVEITNTAANPVPVAGQVNVGTMPAVDAKQSGPWNVGLTGTSAVRLDSSFVNSVRITNDTLTVASRSGRYFGKVHHWADGTGEQRVDSDSDLGSGGSSKVLACVKNRAPLPIFAHVFTMIPFAGGTLFDQFYELDVFVIGSNSDVCKVYDAYGIFVRVIVQSNGNTTGNVSFGISER